MGDKEYSDGVRSMAAHALLWVGEDAIKSLDRTALNMDLTHVCNVLAKAPVYASVNTSSAAILAFNRACAIASETPGNTFVEALNRLPVRPIYHDAWSHLNPMLPKGLMVSFRRNFSWVVVPLDRDTCYRLVGSVEPGYNVFAQGQWHKNVQLVGGSACAYMQYLGTVVNKGRKLGPDVTRSGRLTSGESNLEELPKPKPLWDPDVEGYLREKIQERLTNSYNVSHGVITPPPPSHPNSPCYTVASEDVELSVGGSRVDVSKITFEPEPLSYANGKFLRSLMVKAAKVAGGADNLEVSLHTSYGTGIATAEDYKDKVYFIYSELESRFEASRFGGPYRPWELAKARARINLAVCKESPHALRRAIETALCEYSALADENLSAMEEYERCKCIAYEQEQAYCDRPAGEIAERVYKLAQELLARFTGERTQPEDMTGEAHLEALREWHKFRA